MVEPIGYAPLQIIPVLKDVSAQIDKQLGGALTVSGKRSGVQFGRGVADGLKASEADVKRATDAYGKLADKAKDSLGQIAVAEAKLEKARSGGKQDMIVAAEERLAKVRRDSLRTSKEAEAAHSALLAVQGRLGSSTDDLGGKFSGLSGMASSAGTALLSVGTLAGGAALVGITAFAAGAVRATKELYDLGAQFDDLRDKLQISTGASGAQLEGLVATVERLGTTNVASKFSEIGDVAADVTRNLHLTGPALDDVTSRLANWDRMTGDAVNVRELGKALHGFKVEAADQASTLDMLAGASQASGFSVNELLTAVNKGGSGLREFGFGLSESAGLVMQLNAAGLDAEKMLKGPLNSALVALRKEGKTGADGLKGIVDQIQALLAAGDQLGARGLAEKYFGKKGATDFFDAIKSGNLDLQNLSATLAATGTDINKLAQDTGDWGEHWTILKNKIEKALEPIAGPVFEGINAKLDFLATWVGAHQGEIIDFFVSVGDMAISTADAIHGFVASTLNDMGLLTDLAAKIVGGMATVDEALDHIPGMGGNQKEAADLRKTQTTLQDLSSDLKKDSSKTDAARSAWDKAKDSLHALGEEAKKAASNTDTLARSMVDGKQVFGPFVGTPFLSGAPAAASSGARGSVTSEEASRLGGGTINTSILTSLRGANPSAKLTSGMTDHDKDAGEHPKGKAIDVDPSQANLSWAWANRDKLSMIIYDDPNYVWYNMHGERAEGAAARRIYGESTMKGHGGHIHLAALSEVGGSAPSGSISDLGLGTSSAARGVGGKVPDWDAIAQKESSGNWSIDHGDADSTGGLQIQDRTWRDFGGPELTGQQHAYQATKEQQIAVAEKILAKQGPNAWAGGKNFVWKGGGAGGLSALGGYVSSPLDLSRNTLGAVGPGTPGFDDGGKAGFWKADPKAVREADERASDAVARIADADAAVALALARINELDADASESQKLSAQETLRKAQEDTGKARREAKDAQADLEEAKKGKFTADKEADKSSKGFGGLPSLTSFSGIGSALGEFAGGQIGSALDVFGVGDSPGWLQGIGQLMGGISIGGGGDSFSPLSAGRGGGPAQSLGGMHGGTGAQPGPAGVTYNIQNGGGNDNLITLLKRREQELGAMLGRF